MRPLTLFSVLATVACGIAAVACGDVEPRQRATLGPLRFSHPVSFDRRYYRSCEFMVTGVHGLCLSGVVVASFALGPHPEVASAMASPSGVSFRLHPASHQKPVSVAPAVRFPLSLDDFNIQGRCPIPARCPPVEHHSLFFRVQGKNYWATAWVGRYSSKRLRAALVSVTSSLRAK